MLKYPWLEKAPTAKSTVSTGKGKRKAPTNIKIIRVAYL
jgi:hypothetical protein